MSNSTEVIEVELEKNTYRAEYDFATMAPCTAVVDLLQTITGVDCTDLEPLSEVVDPTAVNHLVGDGENRRSACTVTFCYQRLTITVQSDGTVTIQPHSAGKGTTDG